MLLENADGFKVVFFRNSFFPFSGSNADLASYREGSALLPWFNFHVFWNSAIALIPYGFHVLVDFEICPVFTVGRLCVFSGLLDVSCCWCFAAIGLCGCFGSIGVLDVFRV